MNKELHKNSRIYVAGHKGLVGSAIVRKLQTEGFDNLLLRTHQELELTDQKAVKQFFEIEKPEFVILAAARVGGIYANNTYPADFIFQNIAIQTNVIHEAKFSGVKRLLFLGSSCIYPRDCPQPIKEEYLLSGPLETTNRPYAIAKISGIEMCWSYNRQYDTQYMAVMPTNVYGPEDNYDLETSHVACIHLLSQTEDTLKSCFLNSESVPLINIGCGTDQTISELACIIKNVTGFEGDIRWDTSKPDGTPQKLLDVSRMSELGWDAKINLNDGITQTYQDYVQSLK